MYSIASINIGNVVSGSSARPANVNGTYFYMRATGYLIPSVTGLYTIGVNCADGCSVFIGSQAIVANLTGLDVAHATLAYTQSGTIMLTKNVYYPLIIEWQHGGGSPYELQLIWTPPGGALALIPAVNFSNNAISVTEVIDVSWWNGTSGLWYPGGNGTIDFSNSAHANKTLDHIANGATRVLLPGSGSAGNAATAAASIAAALADLIVLSDGAGNITTAGSVSLASLIGSGGFANPMTAHGDIIYEDASLGPINLPIGVSGYVLTVVAGQPSWAASSSASLAGDSDVQLSSPANGDVLTYVTADGKWENKPATGGGIVAGTMVTHGCCGTGTNTGWANFTLEAALYGELVINPCASWKIRIAAPGGTGIHIQSAALIKTARHSLVALATTPITFNGGSLPYGVAFSGSSTTNPFYLDSDTISAAIDQAHDWYFMIYLDTDGTGYNAAISLWNNPTNYPGLAYNHGSTNLIPAVSGSVLSALTGFSGTEPLIVAIIAES